MLKKPWARSQRRKKRPRTGFAPSSPAAMVYTGVCGQGLGTAERTYTVNLSLWGSPGTGEIAPGAYSFAPGQLSSNGVTLVLQVTENPANQMGEGSINFESATVVVTEHVAGATVAGTFDASWSSDVTVDLHSGSWKPDSARRSEKSAADAPPSSANDRGCSRR